jgi:ubiquinone/menaquinone biosynthesis C-methylase UbiE
MVTMRQHIGEPRLRERVSAAVYDRMNDGMERKVVGERRRRLLEAAHGRVLDVGAGSGANLPHYPMDRVGELVLLDPGRGMLARARRRAEALSLSVELREASAEQLPFEDESFDTVVFTWSLCTIPDPIRALSEARRVLRPDGTLLAMEHVRAREPGLARWQARINPIWNVIGSGCHLDRDTRRSIEGAGFALESVEEGLETRISLPLVQPHLQVVARKVPLGERLS